MYNKTLGELAAGLHDKQYSSVELTQAFLARIAKYPELNAFISISADSALRQAKPGL